MTPRSAGGGPGLISVLFDLSIAERHADTVSALARAPCGRGAARRHARAAGAAEVAKDAQARRLRSGCRRRSVGAGAARPFHSGRDVKDPELAGRWRAENSAPRGRKRRGCWPRSTRGCEGRLLSGGRADPAHGRRPLRNAAARRRNLLSASPGLDKSLQSAFRVGNGLFRRAWIIGPSAEPTELTGLGPLYNRLSCIACHVKNGRGPTPDAENGVARAMVLRLGVGGTRRAGRAAARILSMERSSIRKAFPAFRGKAAPFSPSTPSRRVSTTARSVTIRAARLSLRDLAYGPIGPERARMSPRNAPPSSASACSRPCRTTRSSAHAAGPGGGRPNHVYDVAAGRIRLGRFGLKANERTLPPADRRRLRRGHRRRLGAVPQRRLRARAARLPRGGQRRRRALPKPALGLRAQCSRSRRSGATPDRRCACRRRGAALFRSSAAPAVTARRATRLAVSRRR